MRKTTAYHGFDSTKNPWGFCYRPKTSPIAEALKYDIQIVESGEVTPVEDPQQIALGRFDANFELWPQAKGCGQRKKLPRKADSWIYSVDVPLVPLRIPVEIHANR